MDATEDSGAGHLELGWTPFLSAEMGIHGLSVATEAGHTYAGVADEDSISFLWN